MLMNKSKLEEKVETAKEDGAIVMQDVDGNLKVIYTGYWEDKYVEKNIKFFNSLLKCNYDKLIYVKGNSRNVYFDLVVIRKDGRDLVIPSSVLMESLFMGDEYNVWEEYLNDSAILWKQGIDDVDYRMFTFIIYREDYYDEREV